MVRFVGLAGHQRKVRDAANRQRDRYPDVLRFLRDFLPEEYERVMACDAAGRIWRDEEAGDRWKTTPNACWRIPWCIPCTQRRGLQRTLNAMDKFHRCTPEGQHPRFLFITQTAPITEDGYGWGVQASHDHQGFSKLVWDTAREILGPGIGAVSTYQDFGERAFGKRHPHIHMTVNAWRLGTDGPDRVAWPFRDGQGEWKRVAGEKAMRYDVEAPKWSTNVDARPIITGAAPFFKILGYQLRELVDLRKFEYSRQRNVVYWTNYRENRRERIPVKRFLGGLRDYQSRLGYWHGSPSQQLHREKGHMARSQITRTMRAMNGRPQRHRDACTCNECGTWRREYVDL